MRSPLHIGSNVLRRHAAWIRTRVAAPLLFRVLHGRTRDNVFLVLVPRQQQLDAGAARSFTLIARVPRPARRQTETNQTSIIPVHREHLFGFGSMSRRSYGPKLRYKPGDQQANEAAKDNFCDLMETMLHAAQL